MENKTKIPLLILFVTVISIFSIVIGGLEIFHRSTQKYNSAEIPANTSTSSGENDTNKKNKVKIGFAGDLMFDRYIRKVGEEKGYDFILASSTKLLSEPDLIVANLEGPITNNTSVSLPVMGQIHNPDSFTFTFSPQIAPLLSKSNIQIVSLGNNHSMNFGTRGIQKTKNFLNEAGIGYFGDPLHPAQPYYFERSDIKFAFISWNQFSSQNIDQTLQEIKIAETKANFVIIFAHWGVEYQKTSTPKMQELAHSFIDTGADLVIGAHPHVIGETEDYHGKRIYYSLGNFVFDQYFSPDVRCGLFVTATFSDKEINFEKQTTYLSKNGQTVPPPPGACAG